MGKMRLLGNGFHGKTCTDEASKTATKYVGFRGNAAVALQQRVWRLMQLEEHRNVLPYVGCDILEDGEARIASEIGEWQSGKLYMGRLRESALVWVVQEIMQGLEFLHQDLIAHGDLHAGNVLISPEGSVRLADYGIFDWLRDGKSGATTCVYPPWWSAPELLCDDGQTPRSVEGDIWALGCTIIELAEGSPPFTDMHPNQAREQIMSGAIVPSLTSSFKWSTMLVDFIAQCVAPAPTDRPSLAELRGHKLFQQLEGGLSFEVEVEPAEVRCSADAYSYDPDDILEKVCRSDILPLLPYLSLDAFPPEAFATDRRNASTAEGTPAPTGLTVVPALRLAHDYLEDTSLMSPEEADRFEDLAHDLRSALRNLEKN